MRIKGTECSSSRLIIKMSHEKNTSHRTHTKKVEAPCHVETNIFQAFDVLLNTNSWCFLPVPAGVNFIWVLVQKCPYMARVLEALSMPKVTTRQWRDVSDNQPPTTKSIHSGPRLASEPRNKHAKMAGFISVLLAGIIRDKKKINKGKEQQLWDLRNETKCTCLMSLAVTRNSELRFILGGCRYWWVTTYSSATMRDSACTGEIDRRLDQVEDCLPTSDYYNQLFYADFLLGGGGGRDDTWLPYVPT
jgi:hypothetical protein